MKTTTTKMLRNGVIALLLPISAVIASAVPAGQAPTWYGDVHDVTLLDGTNLTGTITARTSRQVTITTRDGVTIGIPVRLIRTFDGKPVSDELRNGFLGSDSGMNGGREPFGAPSPDGRQSNDSASSPSRNNGGANEASVNDLVAALQSASWERRSAAARELGTRRQWEGGTIDGLSALLGDTVRGSSLLQISPPDSSAGSKLLPPGLEAARALAAMESRGYDELAYQTGNADPLVRQRVAFGLGETGNRACVPILLKALKDRDPLVRATAAGALHYSEAIPQLIKAIDDNDERVRAGAVTALGRIGDVSSENALIAALGDINRSVRSAAASALGTIKSARAVGPLARATADPESDVRLSAVISLGKIRDTATVPPLIAALRDRDGAVVKSAATALGDFRDPRAIEPLRSTMRTCPESARSTVEFSLKLLTEVPLLIGALDDRDSLVRCNVEYLLWLITGKKLGYDKRVWANWFVSRNDTDEAKNTEAKMGDTAVAPVAK